jgi:hypothetical protein
MNGAFHYSAVLLLAIGVVAARAPAAETFLSNSSAHSFTNA